MLLDVRLSEDDFPARNRTESCLKSLEIKIGDSERTYVYEPDALLREHARLDLTRPVGASLISGQPAFLYQEDDVSILLTRDEITRLVTQTLMPAEYMTLRRHYGVFYSVNEDIYDLETGIRWPTR